MTNSAGASTNPTKSPAAHLAPFTTETARKAAARSADVRRAKRDLRRANSLDAATALTALIATHQRHQLGPAAAAVALDQLARLARGEIKVRHAGDLADLLRVLVDITRLEEGASTSNSAVLHMSSKDAGAHLVELQQQARAVLASSAASTEDDAHPAGAELDAEALGE